MSWENLHHLVPSTQANLKEWWVKVRGSIIRKTRNLFDSLTIMIGWTVWQERNSRVFDKTSKPMNTIIKLIQNEAKQWALASAGRLTLETV